MPSDTLQRVAKTRKRWFAPPRTHGLRVLRSPPPLPQCFCRGAAWGSVARHARAVPCAMSLYPRTLLFAHVYSHARARPRARAVFVPAQCSHSARGGVLVLGARGHRQDLAQAWQWLLQWARAAATMWPLLLSWKRQTPVSSKLTWALHTPGELLPCRKLLQAHRAMACKYKKACKFRRKEVQNSAPPCARRQHGKQRGPKIRAAWRTSLSSLGLTRRAAFCSRERRARATQPETSPLAPPAPSPAPRPPERAPVRQRARARWWQRRTGNAGPRGRRLGRREDKHATAHVTSVSVPFAFRQHAWRRVERMQIGRASCRERV